MPRFFSPLSPPSALRVMDMEGLPEKLLAVAREGGGPEELREWGSQEGTLVVPGSKLLP